MKKAQIIIEYAVLSAIAITIVALAVVVLKLGDFSAASVFGFNKSGKTIVVPPMTP